MHEAREKIFPNRNRHCRAFRSLHWADVPGRPMRPKADISPREVCSRRASLKPLARAILLHPRSWAKHSFGPWLTAAAKRLHHNVLTVALANKLARIALTVWVEGRNYETRITPAAA